MWIETKPTDEDFEEKCQTIFGMSETMNMFYQDYPASKLMEIINDNQSFNIKALIYSDADCDAYLIIRDGDNNPVNPNNKPIIVSTGVGRYSPNIGGMDAVCNIIQSKVEEIIRGYGKDSVYGAWPLNCFPKGRLFYSTLINIFNIGNTFPRVEQVNLDGNTFETTCYLNV